MLKLSQELRLSKFLSIGLFVVSIVVTTEGLTDPVNVPKLFVLGILALAALGFLSIASIKKLELKQALPVILFILFSGIAVLKSNSPLSQNVYGSYGRNNGFLAYLFLSLLFLYGVIISKKSNQALFLKSLIWVGYVNVAYCLWVIIFGDFIPWNNPYGNILGTFGNPNFIGAFLGIFFGVLLAFSLGQEATKKFRIILIVLLPITLFEIVESQAIQGRVLAALSLGLVLFFYLRFRVKPIFTVAFAVSSFVIGAFALAGALQKGPLTDLIYKTSVSLRGQYWLAAWNTGESNPFFGVGMDAFGDWYRRSRDARAIELPGINTVVNTAHNVPLDMFAFGGWPLFLGYLVIMSMSLIAVVKIVFKLRSFDWVGVGLITAWSCYQVQSIISINQIGLAVWGWILSGLVISYERNMSQGDSTSKIVPNKGAKKIELAPKKLILVCFFGFVGFILALPPLASDIKLRSAQQSRDALRVEQTMQSNYFNPQNSQKYAINIQAFEGSGLFELSHKYALQAVAWNPEAFELWRLLYFIKNSSPEDRELAKNQMKRLDPLNPDVTAIS